MLNVVKYTGHGIPIIVNKYGVEAFEINDNYILVTIPFNKDVLAKMNVGINDIEKTIIEELIKNPMLSSLDISLIIHKSKRTAERYLKSLQEKGIIVREGANKNGCWKVIK